MNAPAPRDADLAASAIITLLDHRKPGATICPSEAARLVDPTAWRARMPEIHRAAAALAARGAVEITQGGVAKSPRGVVGAYRIRKAGGPGTPTPTTG